MKKKLVKREDGGPGGITLESAMKAKSNGLDQASLADNISYALVSGKTPANVSTIPNSQQLLQSAFMWRAQSQGKTPEQLISSFYGRPIDESNPVDVLRRNISKLDNDPVAAYYNSPNQQLQQLQMHEKGGLTKADLGLSMPTSPLAQVGQGASPIQAPQLYRTPGFQQSNAQGPNNPNQDGDINWDHVMASYVAQNLASGVVSRISPNSQQNTTQRFNQQQFNPMSFLPYTQNNSMQAKYGTPSMDIGGPVSPPAKPRYNIPNAYMFDMFHPQYTPTTQDSLLYKQTFEQAQKNPAGFNYQQMNQAAMNNYLIHNELSSDQNRTNYLRDANQAAAVWDAQHPHRKGGTVMSDGGYFGGSSDEMRKWILGDSDNNDNDVPDTPPQQQEQMPQYNDDALQFANFVQMMGLDQADAERQPEDQDEGNMYGHGGPVTDAELYEILGDEASDEHLDKLAKGGWISKASASIKRRGTKGVCTGSKFGGPTCRPGTRRYALAKTFKHMAHKRKKHEDGGPVGEGEMDLSPETIIGLIGQGYQFDI